ncbi:FRIGIDA interacting protein 1 [Artemisia annua]|uniref:FRIGIDA interacting protein 1 n=1 Tax=Artemisia annua TaxID=35608 RepID=A0A2U1P016_ARTAN|nr:FRIGIDA interacting protein 1 [Artemisia annua]
MCISGCSAFIQQHIDPWTIYLLFYSRFLDIANEAPLCGHRKRASIFGYAALAIGAPWVFQAQKYLTLQILCTCDVVLLIITVAGDSRGLAFLQSGYAALAIGAPWVFQAQKYLTLQILCTCDVVLLIITVAGDSRGLAFLQGYYIFSQKLKHIVRLPFASTSYGTAAMLLIMAWEPHLKNLPIPMILRIIMVAEAILAGSFMSVYIGNVHQYNTLDSQPDVLKSLYSPLQPSSSLEGVRYHDGSRLSDQQMALLQYQRENLNFLSEEILRLQECLSKYEKSGDGMTPQVDLAHLLAARDQELRTLSAEMNQLQSDLRVARSLVAEKETEIQGVRNTNNQYMEENERLRAILGEWSTRAAKLERALESERMSKLEHKKISTLKR